MILKRMLLVLLLLVCAMTSALAQRDDSDVGNQSLGGIKAVKVVVGAVDTFRRPVNATSDTPTTEQGKSDAEFYLKKFGIGVSTSDAADQNVPSLHLALIAQKDDAGGNYYNVRVWLTQPVTLQRDSSIRVEASTWEGGSSGYVIGAKPFANTVCRAIGMFALAYKYVNARETIKPASVEDCLCVRP